MEEKISGQTYDLDEILKKYDKEATYRRFTGTPAKITFIIAIAMSLFHLYTGAFGILLALKHRAVHLIFAFSLVFLLYPARKGSPQSRMSLWDVILALLSIVVGAYVIIYYIPIALRAGEPNTLDLILGGLSILLVLEAARRTLGLVLPITALVFLAYAYFGPYMPGFLAHRGFPLERIISHTYLTTEGIFGIPLGVSATFVFMFILFGAFLEKTGIGKFFIDLSVALTGHTVGGPAKVAVIASALEGTVSGSSVANTVGSGSFTIPLMKSLGYRKEFAAAVEAAASTGGQIMPPVMGAAAFVMSEMIGVPYIEICKAAALPALLYFLAVGLMVHFEAKKVGLVGLPKERLPSVTGILLKRGYFFLPLLAIIFFLIRGSTPLKASFYGVILTIIVGVFRISNRLSFSDFLKALEMGARNALGVVSACACSGMIVGVITLSGMGLKLASGIVELARGELLLTLFYTMIASLILGISLPTTAKYIVLATMAAPAIVKFGVPIVAAHLFILYFGVIADITPPEALAAYAGAGIAGADPWKTGWIATRLALAGFLVPYMFCISPQLLLLNTTLMETLNLTLTAIIGIFALGASLEGHFLTRVSWWERILLFISALLLVFPGLKTDLSGLTLMGIVCFSQKMKSQRKK